MSNTHTIVVKSETAADPAISRTYEILKDRIELRCSTRVVEGNGRAGIILAVDKGLPYEAFRLGDSDDGVRVAGGSPRGLLYGVGKLLRTSRYDGLYSPSPWRGTSDPQGSLRGMYFATHFHNWYHTASEEEIVRYTEDMALWGVNTIMVILPMINLRDWSDPETEPAVALMRRYAKAAKDLGLQFATIAYNAMFSAAPDDIRATPLPDPTHRRGNSGNPVCPGKPEGHAYILENFRVLFERLSDIGLDFLCHWPYDEGGCACEKCRPWGSGGYLRLSRDLSLLGREYFPNLKTILSTWLFDTPPEGEWEGLTRELAVGDPWIDYILADSHEDFPRYPLDVGVPGGLPLINFPEISMWGNWPWGGAGAHPLPSRFQRLWDQVKHEVEGGFPYSEGIYEDMNKAVVTQFYWDRDRSARETLDEYITYEFGTGVSDDVSELIAILEKSASRCHQKQAISADEVRPAWRISEAVDVCLPAWARENWRWEILRLRAVLDRERFGGGGLETPAAVAAMQRLIEIYHCRMDNDDPYHHRVRPPV